MPTTEAPQLDAKILAERDEESLRQASMRMLDAAGLLQFLGWKTKVRENGVVVEKVESGFFTKFQEEHTDATVEGLPRGYRYIWNNGENEVRILAYSTIGVIVVEGEEAVPFFRPVTRVLKDTTEPFYVAIKGAFANPKQVPTEG